MLIVLFGLPGAGKTFVGKILQTDFGYTLYNADRSLPRDMRFALFQKKIISENMRGRFFRNIILKVRTLTRQHSKLVIVQTFLKDAYRKQFLQKFPDAKFLLIKAKEKTREERYVKRSYFNLGLPYLRHMSQLFEKPGAKHAIITNNEEGKAHIRQQLLRLPFLSQEE